MGVAQYYSVRDIHNRRIYTICFQDIPKFQTEKNVNNFLPYYNKYVYTQRF